jgi:hypothetical protein
MGSGKTAGMTAGGRGPGDPFADLAASLTEGGKESFDISPLTIGTGDLRVLGIPDDGFKDF